MESISYVFFLTLYDIFKFVPPLFVKSLKMSKFNLKLNYLVNCV